ncbi:hypothetical protein D3I60_04420 [Brevibacterium permense]|uniref:hypothetical protein n=1 Tax=Brevibacterium permense TaxID=234834 RepID=UPI0021CEE293|nr:hypothetical protein [Brevibacterium permense]MCU4296331.1 hypothetical protein [Brevibacterium permense]
MTTYHPTYLTLAEAIEPHLSVIYSSEAPVDRLGEVDTTTGLMLTRIADSAVVYRLGGGQRRDDDRVRQMAAQLIAEGALPLRGGIVRFTSEEVAA